MAPFPRELRGQTLGRSSHSGDTGVRRRRGFRLASASLLLTTLGTTVGALASVSPASANINSDRNTISSLRAKLAAEGSKAETLVEQYDRLEAHLAALKIAVKVERSRFTAAQHAEGQATSRLRRVAIAAYISAESGSGASFATSADAATLPAREVYLGVASGSLTSASTQFVIDQHALRVSAQALNLDEAKTVDELSVVAEAQKAADAATSSDNAILANVSSNLRTLVTAADARAAAAQARAEEKQLAAEAAQAAASRAAANSAPAAAASLSPTTGTYANPLRAVGGLSPERIDQGVDYGGFGPIFAIGDGTVLGTYNGGWPGGTYITYQLSDGPAAGLVVYAAEDIVPDVQPGEHVTANTVIGQIYEGPTGIETGWANGSLGDTMAATYGEFGGDNTTAFGYNFSQLLSSLGAPGGQVESSPTGSLPGNWPQW